MHFSTLKTASQIEQNDLKTRKIANILGTAGHIAKSSNFQPKTLLLSVPQGMNINFKIYRKKSFVQDRTLC